MAIFTFFMSAVVYLLLLLAGLWCWIHWRHRRLIQAASKIHCLFPTLPFIGNIHYFPLGTDKITSLMIDEAYKLGERGIQTTCFWIGPYPLIVILGVQDIESVLTSTKTIEKGSEMQCIEFVMKKGLITAPANIWKITRPAIDPVFHPRNLSLMMPTFNSNSREFVAKLAQYESKGPVDVFPHIMPYALKSICSLNFGPELKFDTTSKEFQQLIYVVKRVAFLMVKRVFFIWLRNDVIFRFLCKDELKIIYGCWEAFTKSPLKETREIIAKKELQNKEVESEGPENLISVFSKLQEKYPGFTEEDLNGEMFTMLIAGTDTVSATISSCLLHLAYHKNIQEKLFEEILSVVDLEGGITDDDIKRMTYLDQVFKETLRWSVVIPIILRKSSEDVKLSDFTLPAGYTIFLAIGAPSINPSIFPNPKKFDPERFSPENSKDRSRFVFLPFSGGPRSCIGRMYSNLLVKTMVIQVLRKYKLSTTMDVYSMKGKINIFVMSSEGYNISFEPRTS